ncbi:B-cell receptor-associated 31-like protein [Gonapodya prolifera JEL478]|uniref:Endoplasmic reticulum transmembrane protein n=1 Tax=Gonapodya prolifera (strain JEL478) TaxID=1344416 RepID=A0A139A7I0_GONPJ|nr:B-cell receptor-associated 31-like protein [Gonapodya prolifera JEL478]|eukprot:KXS12654.1 B-cell receptor-associated 31-like protein [Gonapodya prolifera JEL478]
MALHYDLCFLLLVAEMIFLGLLLLPWPNAARKGILKALDKNPVVETISQTLRVLFLFVLILFVDSVRGILKETPPSLDPHHTEHHQMQKFASQRNFYLTGFTLFLYPVTSRLVSLLIQVSLSESNAETLRKQAAGNQQHLQQFIDDAAKLPEVQKELEKAKTDLAAMKKQSENLQKAYHDLSDLHNSSSSSSNKKSD